MNDGSGPPVTGSPIGTQEFMTFLQEVAAEVITPRFRALSSEEVIEKHPGDLVTVADREAEVLITARLREAYPDALVLGEEATHSDPGLIDAFSHAAHSFTVDPIDGTKNFVNGSPDHAVMVSELRGGDVVRAWIWQPEHQVGWIAERGAGATRNGERMRRSPLAPEQGPRVVTSIRHLVGAPLGGMKTLELTWVCCGVDYPKLVEGDADAILYGAGNAWDHAPGSLIVTEAGGVLGHTDGSPWVPTDRRGRIIVAGDRQLLEQVRPDIAALLN